MIDRLRRYYYLLIGGLTFVSLGGVLYAAPVSQHGQSQKAVSKNRSNAPAKKGSKPYGAVPETARTVDTIKVKIFAESGIEIIKKSDIELPSLSGAPKSLETVVFERLVYLDAKKYPQAIPDEAAVDRYIARVSHENNLTQADLEQMFSNAGRTYKEGREELRQMQAISGMISSKVHGSTVVLRQEVQKYYDENPQKIEGTVYISRALIPFKEDKKEQNQTLIGAIREGTLPTTIEWSDPLWIQNNELAADKKFILEVPVGGICAPHEVAQGFELFQVHEKTHERIRTLDERYQEIAEELARPKFEEQLESYRTSLLDLSSIVYTTDAPMPAV